MIERWVIVPGGFCYDRSNKLKPFYGIFGDNNRLRILEHILVATQMNKNASFSLSDFITLSDASIEKTEVIVENLLELGILEKIDDSYRLNQKSKIVKALYEIENAIQGGCRYDA